MEQSIGDATVMALTYNMSLGNWVELGSESGTCNINILKSPTNEYRFVAWKSSTKEVVLNNYIFPSMHYDATTPTFHQWYDETKTAYGLNFADQNEAKKFSIAVGIAIETLNEAKTMKPIGDSLKVTKKNVDNFASKSIKKQTSLDSPTKNNQSSFNYSTPTTTNAPVMNNSSTKKEPVVTNTKSSAGAPPPPGPPPAAPPPPGNPPSCPVAPTNKTAPTNDFASQLKAASQNIKSSTPPTNVSEPSASTVTPSNQRALNSGPMDFLSELKLKAQKRPSESAPIKRNEIPKVTTAPTVNTPIKSVLNQSSKISASNSDLSTTSFVTSADLDKFRGELMQDILLNMEKMKDEIISNILAKLN